MQNSNKTTLYIATHNETGLKYFGKTSRYHSQKELQKHYHGSGVYWNKHLKKHGVNVTMSIVGTYDDDSVLDIALKFSYDNDIVESSQWANLVHENGLDGASIGSKHSDATIEKIRQIKLNTSDEIKAQISATLTGNTASIETKAKMSATRKGVKKSDEHKAKIASANLGKIFSAEHKKNIGLAGIGRKHSQEIKSQIALSVSKAQKGVPKRVTICPHCGKSGGVSNMTRYHFENCKLKKDGNNG